MKTIETDVTITPEGKLILHLQISPNIEPGKYRVVLVVDEQPLPDTLSSGQEAVNNEDTIQTESPKVEMDQKLYAALGQGNWDEYDPKLDWQRFGKDFPQLLKMSDQEFVEEIRFLAAAKLYELGRLSSGKAAQLAGMSRVLFLQQLSQIGVPAINLRDEEIEAEIQAAKELVE
jgi:predicted HTH domain antitoxin